MVSSRSSFQAPASFRRRPVLLWIVLGALALVCLSAGHAHAQNNSLFPKGNPNRTLPNATPLPRGGLRPNASTSSASSSARRRPAPPPRPDTVALPYNLQWFDNQNRLASLFAGVSAKVTDKKTDGPNEIWSVKELIAPNLRTSFFTFQQGLLVGLEFDYGQDAWDDAKYNEVMGQFRRLLETKCEAPGEIISRKTDQAPGTTIKETLMGYQWVRGDTNVQLFYYSAEDTSKALNFRSISVHYHYRDPFAPPPGSEPPANNNNAPPAPGASPPPGGQNTSVTVTPAGPDNAPGGTLPLPDNAPPGSTSAPSPAPTPAVSTKSTPTPTSTATPAPTATPTPAPAASPTGDATPGPKTPEASPDNGDTAAAMAPAPSPEAQPSPTPDASQAATPTPEASPAATPTTLPSPTATPTPTPSPKPKKSSGRKKKG